MTAYESGEMSGPTDEPRKIESAQVGLPEYLRRETAEGLLPHTVAYFSPDVLTYDEQTKKIWFYTNAQVRSANLSLESYVRTKHSYIAVMPIIEGDGSRKYVVDASGLETGQLDIVEDWLGYKDEEEGEEISEATKKRRIHHSTLAAAAFTNLEDEIEFYGDPNYFEALQYLVTSYSDTVRANKRPDDDFDYISKTIADGDPSSITEPPTEDETNEAQSPVTEAPKIELIYRIPEDPSF